MLSTFSGLGSSASLVIAPYVVKATSLPAFLIGEGVLGILICVRRSLQTSFFFFFLLLQFISRIDVDRM